MTRTLLIVPLLLLTGGCASVRVPSLEKHAQFVQLVRERLEPDNAIINPYSPFDIRIRGTHATAEYAIEYEEATQLMHPPFKTEFRVVSGKWTVVSHKSNRPWWWRVLDRTVGVK